MAVPRRKAKNELAEQYLRWILIGRPCRDVDGKPRHLYFSDEVAEAMRLWQANKAKILEVWAKHYPKKQMYIQLSELNKPTDCSFNQDKIEKIIAEILEY